MKKLLTCEEGKHHIWTSHHYRKYFLNMCRRYAGTTGDTMSGFVYTGQELGDFWLGHKQQGSIRHYLQYSEEDVVELREHYRQMLPYLSLERSVDILSDDEREELLFLRERDARRESELREIRRRLDALDLDSLLS